MPYTPKLIKCKHILNNMCNGLYKLGLYLFNHVLYVLSNQITNKHQNWYNKSDKNSDNMQSDVHSNNMQSNVNSYCAVRCSQI